MSEESLPFDGDGGPQHLVFLIGSASCRLILLLQLIRQGGGGFAFLGLGLWFVSVRRQFVLRQLVELEVKVHVSIRQHRMF